MNDTHQLTDALGQVAVLKWIIISGGGCLIAAIGAMARYIVGVLERQNQQYVTMVEKVTSTIQRNNDLLETVNENCPCADERK